ncbi:MAG: imidazolonepropionase, partial [Myxococcales bacterium]|nr:imidazolonepropionase [Myxococcales bacterium]
MSDPERLDLLIRGAHLCTCAGPPGAPAAERLDRIPDGAVGVRGGRIVYVGSSLEAPGDAAEIVDAEGRALSPGLVDPHTHLVFAGSRVDEFARRMAGEDYRAIAAAGGGIVATVRATRAASDEELYAGAAARALAMRARGVTAVEIKSGYGLSLEHESRLLRVARRLDAEGLLRVRTSFLGAHAIPPERRGERARYLDELVQQMLPAIVEEGLADAIDVYCDEGAFTLEETRRLLEAGREAGLGLRAHLGQFADLGGPELLAELGALSADHLEEVSDAGLAAMARADVIAVLLPGAFCTLRQRPPSVSRMRAAGVRMAVGTDCNPGTSPST